MLPCRDGERREGEERGIPRETGAQHLLVLVTVARRDVSSPDVLQSRCGLASRGEGRRQRRGTPLLLQCGSEQPPSTEGEWGVLEEE